MKLKCGFLIGALLLSLNVVATTDEEFVEKEVETIPVSVDARAARDVTKSYRDRRPTFSHLMGFTYSQYNPVNYQPFFVSSKFVDYYGAAASSPLMMLEYNIMWNSTLGAMGLGIAAGQYQASAPNSTTLSLTPGFIFLKYAMTNLLSEPYVVPYATFGSYMMMYRESQGSSNAVGGNTAPAMFYSLGLSFQLDWMDRETHDDGYKDNGVHNTFLFLEARSLFSSGDRLTDFSSPLQLGAGLQIEFE